MTITFGLDDFILAIAYAIGVLIATHNPVLAATAGIDISTLANMIVTAIEKKIWKS